MENPLKLVGEVLAVPVSNLTSPRLLTHQKRKSFKKQCLAFKTVMMKMLKVKLTIKLR